MQLDLARTTLNLVSEQGGCESLSLPGKDFHNPEMHSSNCYGRMTPITTHIWLTDQQIPDRCRDGNC